MAKRYLEMFEPDFLVETREGQGKRLGYADDRFGGFGLRCVQLSNFHSRRSYRSEGSFHFGMNIVEVYRFLYETERKFALRNPNEHAVFPLTGKDAAPFELAFGVFPSQSNLRYIHDTYVNVFSPSPLPFTYASYEHVIRKTLTTPFRVTNFSLETSYASNSIGPQIFIYDHEKATDIIDVWNLRLVYPGILPIPLMWVSNATDLINEIISNSYRPIPDNPHGVMTRTVLEFGASIPEETAKQIIQEKIAPHSPKDSYIVSFRYDPAWSVSTVDWMPRLRKAEIVAKRKSIDVDVTDDLHSWIETISPKFGGREEFTKASWANVLSRYAVTGAPIANCLPLKRKFSELQRVTEHDFLVGREGLVFFPKRELRELVRWATGRQVFTEWLNARGIGSASSDAGRTAEEIIRAIGDLRNAHIFAANEILEKLNEMSGRRLEKIEGAAKITKEYSDRTARVKSWIDLLNKINSTRNRKPWRKLNLSDFTSRNVLRLGITTKCTHCQKENWHSLDDLSYSIQCQRCLQTYAFPQGDLDFSSAPWHYRVVGPFSVPDYAAGGYATVLALRFFTHALGMDTNVTFCTGTDLRIDNFHAEVDFMVYYSTGGGFGEYSTPVPIIGEAKSFGYEAFRSRDISALKAISERLPGAVICCATLKREFSPDEKRSLAAFALWGRHPGPEGLPRCPVLLLTATELFSEWHLDAAWKEAGGNHAKFAEMAHLRLDNLWTLSDLTQQLYLDLPPHSEWRRSKYMRHAKRRTSVKLA